jgi:hypothetical protein
MIRDAVGWESFIARAPLEKLPVLAICTKSRSRRFPLRFDLGFPLRTDTAGHEG